MFPTIRCVFVFSQTGYSIFYLRFLSCVLGFCSIISKESNECPSEYNLSNSVILKFLKMLKPCKDDMT